MNVSKNKEDQIMAAARKLFFAKGYDGTSVQDIAKSASTTKSMVNYYFRSKEKLFSIIFREEFRNLFSSIGFMIMSDVPLKNKIQQIIELDTEKLIQFPSLPIFVMSELHRNPEVILKDLEGIPIKLMLQRLDDDIRKEVKKGAIQYIEPIELMMYVQSMTIYPMLAKPLVTTRLGLSEKAFNQKMNQRKTTLTDFIWKSIKK